MGLGVGAAVGGVVGALVDVGVPKEHAAYYAEGVRRGGTLVVVRALETDVEDVTDIMRRHEPVDIEQRAAEWRAAGWAGLEDEWYSEFEDYEPSFQRHYEQNYAATDYPYDRYQRAYRYGYHIAADERYADYEWEEIEPEVRSEWNQRFDGDTEWDNFGDAVRHGWAEVRDEWRRDYGQVDDYRQYEPEFRRHYETTYAGTPYGYADYEPAYQYGYTLATNPRYRGRTWSEIEPEARRRWEADEDTAWEDMSAAVEHAWDEVEDALGNEDEEYTRP
jgi:predicted glutamine amidotransferase